MSTWVGIAPLIGAGSLDGFAIGALASGACFMAITAPRRARKRQAAAAADGRPAAGQDGWLCEHVVAAEAFPADDDLVVLPEPFEVPDAGPASPAGRGGRPAGGRHRLGDPVPGGLLADQGSADIAPVAFPGGPLPAGTSRHAAFPEGAFSGGASRGAHRDGGLPDVAFPDGAPGNEKRPEARRLPRHAAPGISLSSRMSNLMTGRIASRALIGGAHG
jgi:hypothetical protein